MNLEPIFTSTGCKLLHHPRAIASAQKRVATPISLQIAPTSKCNLNCSFCSNVNREDHEYLESVRVIDVIRYLRSIGLQAVEWTGGGDPTMWKPIEAVLRVLGKTNISQGMITNGIKLKEMDIDALNSLSWIRISMNCLDHVSQIDIPDFKGTLGFSYVMNDKTDSDTFIRINEYIDKYDPAYVRIVPNCQATNEEHERDNANLKEMVKDLDRPQYFFQEKRFEKSPNCWWGYFKPFLHHDGYIYPCSSVVLNSDSDRQFHSKYRWVDIDHIKELYDNKMTPFDASCDHCVFAEQNRLVDSIINKTGMETFI